MVLSGTVGKGPKGSIVLGLFPELDGSLQLLTTTSGRTEGLKSSLCVSPSGSGTSPGLVYPGGAVCVKDEGSSGGEGVSVWVWSVTQCTRGISRRVLRRSSGVRLSAAGIRVEIRPDRPGSRSTGWTSPPAVADICSLPYPGDRGRRRGVRAPFSWAGV